MATATVYTISDGVIVEQFDIDYNYAIGEYHGKRNRKGTYYIAKKGVVIPFPEKNRKSEECVSSGGSRAIFLISSINSSLVKSLLSIAFFMSS